MKTSEYGARWDAEKRNINVRSSDRKKLLLAGIKRVSSRVVRLDTKAIIEAWFTSQAFELRLKYLQCKVLCLKKKRVTEDR